MFLFFIVKTYVISYRKDKKVNKIIVIGSPGSGKSTFSRKLSKITGIDIYHLDNIFWNEDRTSIEISEFDKEVKCIIEKQSWIIDGNYFVNMHERINFADTVFFLDYNTDVCISGIMERRGEKKDDIPFVEPEDEIDEDLLNLVKDFKIKVRPEIFKLLNNCNKKIYIFKTRDETQRFLETIRF